MRTIWIAVLTCAVLLCGCEASEGTAKDDSKQEIGIEVVEQSTNGKVAVIRDMETNVLYLIINFNTRGSSITPLYNADGSLRTYEQK